MPPRRPRHVRARRTQLWLSEEAHALIRTWSSHQGLSFSAGIESLARLGLRQAPTDALGLAVGRAAARTVRAEVGALRALFAATALEGAQTRRLVTAILRHLPPVTQPHPGWTTLTRQWEQLARRDAVQALNTGDALRELGWHAADANERDLSEDDDPPSEAPGQGDGEEAAEDELAGGPSLAFDLGDDADAPAGAAGSPGSR